MENLIITLEELRIISGREKFSMPIIEKDYLITYLLFLLKDVRGIYLKGGTAINKIFLNHARLSEDIDFTITGDVKEIQKEIMADMQGELLFSEEEYEKAREKAQETARKGWKGSGEKEVTQETTNWEHRDELWIWIPVLGNIGEISALLIGLHSKKGWI